MINLMHGDCLELMKNIPDHSVDMILCDLPYGTTACKWDNIIPFDLLWEKYERICKSNGTVVLFGSEPFSTELRHSNLKKYRYDLIWIKEQASSGLFADSQPLKVHENISVFYSSDIMNDTSLFFDKSKDYLISEKKKAENAGFNVNKVLGNYMGSHYFTRASQFAFPKYEDYVKLQGTGFFEREYDDAKREYDDAKRVTYNPQMSVGIAYKGHYAPDAEVHGKSKHYVKDNEGTRYPTSILYYNRERGLHPTQKPVPLLEYLIKTYTNEGETVLDNCMGSGSTGVACVNTGRNFIGIELEPKYFDIAQKRIYEAAGMNIEEKKEEQTESDDEYRQLTFDFDSGNNDNDDDCC